MAFNEPAKISGCKRSSVWAAVLIALLSCCVYANSLKGEFIWDDEPLIRDNAQIKSWSNFSEVLTGTIPSGTEQKSRFYRPVQMVTYMIDHSFWGTDVRGYHLTNIIVHAVASVLVFWMAETIFQNTILSLLTGLFFAAHPVQTEAVAYISGRADPLALVFMLLSLILYIKNLTRGKTSFTIFMVVSYALALLSKEISLVFPVLIFLYHFCFHIRIRLKPLFPVMGTILLYVLLRWNVLRDVPVITGSSTLIQRAPGAFAAFAEYIRLLLYPAGLHMEYGIRSFSFSDPQVLIGIVLSLSLLLYAVKVREKNRLAVFAVFWFFITLIPVLNLSPVNAYMAEHWLYIPSIGFYLIVAQLLFRLYQNRSWRIPVVLLTLAMLGGCIYLAVIQNRRWRNHIAFYEYTARFSPDSSRVFNNLGGAYKDAGDRVKAMAQYEKAIEVDPLNPYAYFNLGNLHKDAGDYAKAEEMYRRAIEIDPRFPDAYNNLGVVLAASGRLQDAVRYFETALRYKPDFKRTDKNLAKAYYDLGERYMMNGMTQEAVLMLKRSIDTESSVEAYNELGAAFFLLGRQDEAVMSFEKAKALGAGR